MRKEKYMKRRKNVDIRYMTKCINETFRSTNCDTLSRPWRWPTSENYCVEFVALNAHYVAPLEM